MTKKEEEILRKNLGVSEEEFERLKSEDINLEKIKKQRPAFVSTNTPIPAEKNPKFISTHDLPSDLPTQRYWDREKTQKKPAFVTSDIPNPEDVEAKKKRAEVMAEIKKQKEKK